MVFNFVCLFLKIRYILSFTWTDIRQVAFPLSFVAPLLDAQVTKKPYKLRFLYVAELLPTERAQSPRIESMWVSLLVRNLFFWPSACA